jgi:hypothetical protein
MYSFSVVAGVLTRGDFGYWRKDWKKAGEWEQEVFRQEVPHTASH